MSKEINYELDIRFPDQSPHRVNIIGKLSLGSSSQNDLCIEEYNLSPLHLSFRIHNGVLSLHNLGGKNPTILEGQELYHGKMYILNVGDNLKLGDIEIFIREGDSLDDTPDNLKNLFEDKTDPNFEVMSEEPIEYQESLDNKVQNDEDEDEENKNEELTEEQTEEGYVFQSTEDFVNEDAEAEEDTIDEKTFVKKLTSIFKVNKKNVKKDFKKDIVKNNKKISTPKVAPGFFIRLFSFLSLAAISYTVVDQIFPIFELDKFIDVYVIKLQEMLVTIPYGNYLSVQIIKIIFVYIIIDIVSTAILGMNITYLLLGIRNDDGAISKRLKGTLRSIIGVVTTPFLIFDLPSIIKKRTLKELLTRSKLHTPSRLLQSLGVLIITPLLLLSPLYTPILLNMDKFKATEVVQQQPLKFSKKEETIREEWSSSSMNLSFKGKVSKRLMVLPTIKMNKNLVESAIKMNSKKNLNAWTTISFLQEIDILDKLKPLTLLNPMFSIQYPELNSELAKESEQFSTLAFDQLFKLLKKSINLDPLNLQDIFLNHGPFLKDLLEINYLLVQNLDIQENDSISIFKSNDKILIGNTKRSTNSIRTKYLIINRAMLSSNFRVSTPKKYFRYTSKMVENFFQNTSVLDKSKENKNLTWAKTLDLLTSITETKKDLEESELSEIYEYYFEFTRNFLIELSKQKTTDSDEYKKSLILEITNISKYLESTLEVNEFQKVSELDLSLKRLIENFEKENLDFFTINK